jgi:hypothetical protein
MRIYPGKVLKKHPTTPPTPPKKVTVTDGGQKCQEFGRKTERKHHENGSKTATKL